jgi:hypothetical protein
LLENDGEDAKCNPAGDEGGKWERTRERRESLWGRDEIESGWKGSEK